MSDNQTERRPITMPPGPRARKRLEAEEQMRQYKRLLNELHYQNEKSWQRPESIHSARASAKKSVEGS